MLAAMTAAEVGDDVFGEDPTVNRLEERVADFLGKEAALFVPSGTMSNQIAVRAPLPAGRRAALRGDQPHLPLGGAAARRRSAASPAGRSTATFGVLDVRAPRRQGPPADDIHSVRTAARLPGEHAQPRRRPGLPARDGREAISRVGAAARPGDAPRRRPAVERGRRDRRPGAGVGRHFDTVSVCFSKGLGAPVGSALAGPRGPDRAGPAGAASCSAGRCGRPAFLAAACLYALDHHIDRLAEDHANAQLLAEAVADTPGLTLAPPEVETNLVWFEVDPEAGHRPGRGRAAAGATGCWCRRSGQTVVRACTHLDVSRADCERAAEAIRRLARG